MSWNVVDRYNLDPTGELDNADHLAHMRAEMDEYWTARKPKPRMVWPEGTFKFSRFPNMALHNMEMVSEGETVLKYTGTEDAVTFMGEQEGELPTLGKRNVVFDGFIIDPGDQARHGLMVASCHASHFRVSVLGAGAPRGGVLNSAIYMKYCVVTRLYPTVSSLDIAIAGLPESRLDCVGVTMDIIGQQEALPASAVQVMMPVLEGLTEGMHYTSAFFCIVRDGTIEYCRKGINYERGGYCSFLNVEMEGNQDYDIRFSQHAHDNHVWLCGNGHRRQFRVVDESLTTGNIVTPIGPPFS
jgi:hypothetical protein